MLMFENEKNIKSMKLYPQLSLHGNEWNTCGQGWQRDSLSIIMYTIVMEK